LLWYCAFANWQPGLSLTLLKEEITKQIPSFITLESENRLIFRLQLALKQNCLDHLKRNQWFHFAAIEKSRVSIFVEFVMLRHRFCITFRIINHRLIIPNANLSYLEISSNIKK
jgi:hypothetical protein